LSGISIFASFAVKTFSLTAKDAGVYRKGRKELSNFFYIELVKIIDADTLLFAPADRVNL